MKKLIHLAALVALAAFFPFCKTSKKTMPTNPTPAVWAEIDSLEQQGLLKSALEKTDAVLASAKAKNDWPEHVKALLFRAKFQAQLDEKGLVTAISELQKEEKLAAQPEKAVLQSMLGQLFSAYLQSQGWQIRQRTAAENGPLSDDIQTWSAQDFERQADAFFAASVASSAGLENVQLVDCEAFMSKTMADSVDGQPLRPTLFDLLAHRAAEHFSNPTSYVTLAVADFVFDQKTAFSPAAEFAAANFGAKKSDSRIQKAVEIFQIILQKRLAQPARKAALIDADLARLRFSRQQSTLAERDDLYEKALESLQKQHEKTIFEAEIAAARAQFFYEKYAGDGPAKDGKPRPFLKIAAEIADPIIDAYPKTAAAATLRNLVKSIRERSVSLTLERENVPNRPMLALLNFKNLETVWFRFFEAEKGSMEAFNRIENNDARLDFIKKLKESAAPFSQKLAAPDDHYPHSSELRLPAQPLGPFFVLTSDNPDFSTKNGGIVSASSAFATNLAAVVQTFDEKIALIVADRTSGQPVAGAEIEFFSTDWDGQKQVRRTIEKTKTDRDGIARTAQFDGRNMSADVADGQDFLTVDGIWTNRPYENPPHRTAAIFTDRAIFRPGQLVFFKAILIEKDGKGRPKILAGQTVEAQLLDANGQKTASLTLKSNDFGSVSGQFALPTSGLTGVFYLSIIGENGLVGNANFRVEEYKRPRFEAKIQPIEGEFRVNDEVAATLEAANLAGSVLDGAAVKWRVRRVRRYLPWWDFYKGGPPNFGSGDAEIAFGEGQTDEKGQFKIKFRAAADATVLASEKPSFQYEISAVVTDAAGESHDVTRSVSIGYEALELPLGWGSAVDLDSFRTIILQPKNLNGQPVAASGSVKITRVESPFFKPRFWGKPDVWTLSKSDYQKDFAGLAFRDEDELENLPRQDFSFSKTWKSGEPIDLAGARLAAGFYEIVAETTDRFGQKVESKATINLIDFSKKRVAQKGAPLEVFFNKPMMEVGEKAEIWINSDRKNGANIFASVERRGAVSEAKWLKMSKLDDLQKIDLVIEEADRGDLFLSFWTVADGRFYSNRFQIEVPFSNQKLSVETSVFRDKLAPGQAEEWRLKIKGPKGEKIAAEVVAGMFDASLEAFSPHVWQRGQLDFPKNWSRLLERNAGFDAAWPIGNWQEYVDFGEQKGRIYPEIDWFNFPFYGQQVVYRSEAMMDSSMPMPTSAGVPGQKSRQKMATNGSGGDEMVQVESAAASPPVLTAPAGQKAAPTVRKNLSELAFFKPDILTDADGNIVLKFTSPEALTRWKMMVFAHSKDLKTGFLEREIVTQKELMVLPNMPRFLREGDEIEVVGKVSNLSQNDLNGNAKLELFDAISMQPIDNQWFTQKNETDFVAKKGQSAAVKFMLKVPMGRLEPIVWRMSATAAGFSDAEENALAVVTNRMLVTETMPMAVRGGQTKNFDFSSFQNSTSKTLVHQNFAVEFSENPAWYAVQALPFLIEYPHECTEQIASRLFANSLAAHVANSNPKIRAVFDRWKSQPEALKSNLSKNQELKNALLEETPWVLEAQSEEQKKRQIGLLFDLNRMADEQEKALRQLAERQQSDGGWAWFPGGRTDWWVTSHVLELLGRLDFLTKNEDIFGKNEQMVTRAAAFCDARLAEYFSELKKQKGFDSKANHFSPMLAQHLYARKFFVRTNGQNQVEKAAFDWSIQQAKTFWTTQNLQTQAQIAVALHHFGEKETAKAILRSLRERAIVSDELGMYWPFDRGFYFFQMPIEAQSLMIEAFSEIENDQKTVENLRIWLLKNKQTVHWKTTTATAAAIYSLLIGGDAAASGWLDSSKPLAVKVGGKTLDQKAVTAEAGTGYWKKTFEKGEIRPVLGKIEVQNPNVGPAWGAAFWQYFEDIDKVKSFEKTPLTIRRQFFKIENSATGPVLKDFSTLKIGDRVRVRIEIRSDREMEFLHLKDTRASGLEPVDVLSQYRWQDGLGYYQSTRDLATHFFIDRMPKGTFVFEYELRVQQKGDFSSGVTTMECMYAPEFSSHAAGGRLRSE